MSHGPRWRDYLSWAGGIVSGLVLARTAVSAAGPTAPAAPAEVLTEAQGGTRLSPTRWPTGPSRRCWATATSSLLTARNFAQLAVRGDGYLTEQWITSPTGRRWRIALAAVG